MLHSGILWCCVCTQFFEMSAVKSGVYTTDQVRRWSFTVDVANTDTYEAEPVMLADCAWVVFWSQTEDGKSKLVYDRQHGPHLVVMDISANVKTFMKTGLLFFTDSFQLRSGEIFPAQIVLHGVPFCEDGGKCKNEACLNLIVGVGPRWSTPLNHATKDISKIEFIVTMAPPTDLSKAKFEMGALRKHVEHLRKTGAGSDLSIKLSDGENRAHSPWLRRIPAVEAMFRNKTAEFHKREIDWSKSLDYFSYECLADYLYYDQLPRRTTGWETLQQVLEFAHGNELKELADATWHCLCQSIDKETIRHAVILFQKVSALDAFTEVQRKELEDARDIFITENPGVMAQLVIGTMPPSPGYRPLDDDDLHVLDAPSHKRQVLADNMLPKPPKRRKRI